VARPRRSIMRDCRRFRDGISGAARWQEQSAAVKILCELSEVRSRSLQLEAFSMTSWHSVRAGQLSLAFIAASPSCSSPVLR
jgi:hypothetical protein